MFAAVNPMAKNCKSRPMEEWGRKPLVLQIRGTPEWKSWLDEAAEFNRTTVANLVDQAIARFVRESGFTKPPPRR